jgi:hypothetical protein
MLSTFFNYRDIIIMQLRSELAEKNKIIEEFTAPRPPRRKLKWILDENTYRVAVETANGLILQVKSVTDGGGDVIEGTERCINGRYPLKKTYFETEAHWRASLPDGGRVIIE